MSLRSIAVQEARAKGICTQCLKNPAKEHMYQCQRCIDTNNKKQKKRERRRHKMKLCKCGEPAKEGRKACEACLEKQRVYWRKKYANKKARETAFGNKDELPKRKYTKRIDLSPVQMQGMINELELFISRLPKMTASEYLEARENLIKNILIRGK